MMAIHVLDVFITNEPVALERQGYKINTILASDYGIDIYSNVIFTTEDTIANRPDLVESFLRATLKGYEEVINNPNRAAELSVKYNPELDIENEKASMQASLPLLKPTGSQPGMMQPAVWTFAHQTLLNQNLLSEPLDVNQAYTLDFLNKIYP